MDNLRFSMSIGHDTLFALGLLLLVLTGVGIVMGFLICPRMRKAISEGKCPCTALLGETKTQS
jgi:hypothetical protein